MAPTQAPSLALKAPATSFVATSHQLSTAASPIEEGAHCGALFPNLASKSAFHSLSFVQYPGNSLRFPLRASNCLCSEVARFSILSTFCSASEAHVLASSPTLPAAVAASIIARNLRPITAGAARHHSNVAPCSRSKSLAESELRGRFASWTTSESSRLLFRARACFFSRGAVSDGSDMEGRWEASRALAAFARRFSTFLL
mmetsp:Transcript_27361/g.82844  ORF Transcript_27361/g.82844 Transcript_27361/m.82844 type:complete len:201 (-) Transcript_27361:311-913(-)